MELIVRELASKKDLKTFIYLPEKIHKSHAGWVHPYYQDEWRFFDSGRNKFFEHCQTTLAIAWRGNQAVGRVMGIINPHYNDTHQEKNGRFCFLECYHDIGIARALLQYVEEWAAKQGMNKVVGPLGFSDKDPQGMLYEGYDERVLIATNYNFPWMNDFLAELGYTQETDLVSYKAHIPEKIPEYLEKVYARKLLLNDLVLHEFSTSKALEPWVVPIFRLINETYTHIYGFVPLTEEEMRDFAKRYLPLLNPHFIKLICDKQHEVVAFLISMPELSEGMRRARGRLFPFGWYHILSESRKTTLLTMLLGAIRESWRGKGLDALMGMKLLESAQRAGMKVLDSHLILEHNKPMRAEYERIGGVIHKRYRIYQKSLA